MPSGLSHILSIQDELVTSLLGTGMRRKKSLSRKFEWKMVPPTGAGSFSPAFPAASNESSKSISIHHLRGVEATIRRKPKRNIFSGHSHFSFFFLNLNSKRKKRFINHHRTKWGKHWERLQSFLFCFFFTSLSRGKKLLDARWLAGVVIALKCGECAEALM